MDELPEYIHLRGLCALTGLSIFVARRFIDRYQIERDEYGSAKFMKTQDTLLKLAEASEVHHAMNERGKALMREVREALAAA
jgi:hypothetical protein